MTLEQAKELLRPTNHGGLLALIGEWHASLDWLDDNFDYTEHLVSTYEAWTGKTIEPIKRAIIVNECQSHFFMVWQ